MRSPADAARGGAAGRGALVADAGDAGGDTARPDVAGRVLAERALRALTLGALGLALWQRLLPAPPGAARAVARADAAALPAALARWTAASTPLAHADLDTLPGPAARAWLAAVARAGTRLTWQAARAPALAGALEPAADPAGGLRLLAAAPAGALVRAADGLGPLDSVRAGGPAAARGAGDVSHAAGIVLPLPDVTSAVRVQGGGGSAQVPAPRDAPRLGAVLVVAHAGWEGRFAAAALEERGWTVRTRFAVAPRVTVGDAPRAAGRPDPLPRLDTAALAAVVALDSAAAPLAPALARYVRGGGGLVLSGDAARVPALAALAPAASGPAVDDSAGVVTPLVRPRADAVPLAYRQVDGARQLVAAARRVGAGRVVQLADAESWRRRLSPDDAAPAAHRAWWAQAVAAAAYAPSAGRPAAVPPPVADSLRDPAPLAATVAALGPAAPPPSTPDDARGADRAPAPRVPDAVLVPLALTALLAEVASRRLRGSV